MKIELHSAEKVAETLGVELDTLYRYARKGKIPGLKVGKAWRFLDGDVKEFLQRQRYSVKTLAPKATLLPDVPKGAATGDGVAGGVKSGGGEVSYADVEAASNLLAESLLSHGVVPGDLVLILLSNSLEFVVGCFAVWKAGAALVPENPSLKDEDLRHILEKWAPRALIMDLDVAQRLEAQHCGLENMRVVYIKERTFSFSGLGAGRVESLDAVLESKSGHKLLRIYSASPDPFAAPLPAV
jgi:excisionase family DNA binding protein